MRVENEIVIDIDSGDKPIVRSGRPRLRFEIIEKVRGIAKLFNYNKVILSYEVVLRKLYYKL